MAELTTVICQQPPPVEPGPHFAALFERLSPTNAVDWHRLFEYRRGDEDHSEAARAFIELAGLIEQHLAPFYAKVLNGWKQQLASAISGALREFFPQLGSEPLAMLAVDCHPWNGFLGLAALTSKEVATESLLANPTEMAAWRHYDFAQELPSWTRASELGQVMKSAYETGNRKAVVDVFMHACASALTSQSVRDSLMAFVHSDGFRLSVTHPDDGREFVALQDVIVLNED